ncbi:MAG: hypothetical protein Q9M92_11790 [Enterobacterales bacterium]|nr:hypothetical protein [Enterobacterales bacterium]
MIITFGEFNPSKAMAGFPRFTFTHPFSSTKLAMIPIGFGILFSFSFVILWFLVIAQGEYDLSQYALILAACCIAVVWFQFIAWRLFNAPYLTVSIFIFLVVALSVCFISLWHREITQPLVNRKLASFGLVILAVTGFWLAINAVKSARTNQIFENKWHLSELQIFGFSLPTSYQSKQQAIFRYEWRVFGWMLPAASLFLGSFFVFLVSKTQSNIKGLDLILLMLIFLFYVPLFTPSVLCKTHMGSKSSRILAFSAQLPISNFDLAMAKLKLAFKSKAIFFLVTMIPINIHLVLMTSEDSILQPWQWLSENFGVFKSLLIWIALNLSVPIISWSISSNAISWLLKGKSIFNVRLMTYAAILVSLIVFISVRVYLSETFRLIMVDLLPIINILVFLCIAIVFMQSIKRFRNVYSKKYSNENNSLNIVVLWVGAILSFFLLTLWLAGTHLRVNYHASLILFDFAMLLVLPILNAPFSIRENRSR